MGAEIQPAPGLLPPRTVLFCFVFSILHKREAQAARGPAHRDQPPPSLLGPFGMSPHCGLLSCWSLPLGHSQAVPQHQVLENTGLNEGTFVHHRPARPWDPLPWCPKGSGLTAGSGHQDWAESPPCRPSRMPTVSYCLAGNNIWHY